jgi:transducin (beta)-like 1
MSIVLKSDEVNYVVYKYLMETGLAHTAFSMFYEANLEEPAKEFRYDVQAGYLITLFERALLLTQIESHVFLVL